MCFKSVLAYVSSNNITPLPFFWPHTQPQHGMEKILPHSIPYDINSYFCSTPHAMLCLLLNISPNLCQTLCPFAALTLRCAMSARPQLHLELKGPLKLKNKFYFFIVGAKKCNIAFFWCQFWQIQGSRPMPVQRCGAFIKHIQHLNLHTFLVDWVRYTVIGPTHNFSFFLWRISILKWEDFTKMQTIRREGKIRKEFKGLLRGCK